MNHQELPWGWSSGAWLTNELPGEVISLPITSLSTDEPSLDVDFFLLKMCWDSMYCGILEWVLFKFVKSGKLGKILCN